LAQTLSAARGTVRAARSRASERRQLTVLFCDLISSTGLFGDFDPEEVGALLRSYHECCAQRIEAAGGFVAQFQGDGVIGYFGYTHASEDNAERAVRTALELVRLVPRLHSMVGRRLEVRVGIATGLVVVGDPLGEGTRLEQAAVGDTLHLAARLQGQATANEIIIADRTRRLTGSLFVHQNRGRLALKGFAEPIQAWRVMKARPAVSQFRLLRDQVLTQIVGRDTEIDLLLQTWRSVIAGKGHLVTIIGEAGIGKSRLITEFRHRIAGERHFWLESGGAQFFGNTPLYPVVQMIRRLLDPGGRASSAEFRSRLERALKQSGLDASPVLSRLAEALDQPASGPPSSHWLPDQRESLFAALFDWIRGSARLRPLVIVLEDLHWVDASSLDLAIDVLARISSLPVLLLCSARPEFQPPWPSQNTTELRLRPLADHVLRRIVARLATNATDDEIDLVVGKADGVPLFGIELARLMHEQRARLGDLQVPASLSDLLMARLDQLGSAKSVAQLASVIGGEFPIQVLGAISDLPAARLRASIAALRKCGILQKTPGKRAQSFVFSHVLLRDAAYQSLLRSERRNLHRRIAHVISESPGAIASYRPETLAYHWTHAGELDLAVAAWRRAGDFAAAHSAFKEAEQAYKFAIDVLMQLPAASERNSQEMALQSLLADTLRITRGLSAEPTQQATARARTLAETNGDREQQQLQSWGAWAAASSSGDYETGLRLADQFYRLALADGSTSSLASAHMMQMTSRYRIGDLQGAERHFTRGEPFFADPVFRRRAGNVAQTHGNAALISWTLGDDLAAQARIDHALATARENDTPYDSVYAKYMAAMHAVLSDRHDQAVELATTCIRLCDDYAVAQFAATSRIVLGRAQSELGRADVGVELIREGLAKMATGSVRVALTLYVTWLTEAYVHAGSLGKALHAADQALEANPRELFFRPETVRLRGVIRMRLGMLSEAGKDFVDALEMARRMGAGRLTERSARSLRHFLQETAHQSSRTYPSL
jgi:class 3 adenylate cyclase/tetratricopeptide (TPR) repeat protein